MAEVRTKANEASVEDFLNGVTNDRRREDAFALLQLMKAATRQPPKMWGSAIVGFDRYRYRYESGREGEICMLGFSPRSNALALYVDRDFEGAEALMQRLGRHTTSDAGGCLYIKRLEDVHLPTLRKLLAASYRAMKRKHG